METRAESPDLALQLPRDAYWQAIHTLHSFLPPPLSESPEDLARRDNAAIARVAAMLPVNAEEADLAARAVAHGDYGMDCLRLAGAFRSADPEKFLKCLAQAASMER